MREKGGNKGRKRKQVGKKKSKVHVRGIEGRKREKGKSSFIKRIKDRYKEEVSSKRRENRIPIECIRTPLIVLISVKDKCKIFFSI